MEWVVSSNQEERRASFFLAHEEKYRNSEIFKWMVDSTVYFTDAEREESYVKAEVKPKTKPDEAAS